MKAIVNTHSQVLFSGTIAENIGYRDILSGVDMNRVRLAAETANADEFIKCLPNQYNTTVGPRGSNFSGGQRQRQGDFILMLILNLMHTSNLNFVSDVTFSTPMYTSG